MLCLIPVCGASGWSATSKGETYSEQFRSKFCISNEYDMNNIYFMITIMFEYNKASYICACAVILNIIQNTYFILLNSC